MSVRSLSRGLRILQRLSTSDGLSTNEVARQLSLPRGTCHRLLRTLETEGYISATPSDGRWRTTPMTHSLGRSEDWESWVSAIAIPLIDAFTARNIWPLVVSTLHGLNMVVRASSDRGSPLALQHYRRGFLLTLTGTSAGRVYLAYSPPSLRHALVELLGDEQLPALSRRFLANLESEVAQILEQRYATSPLIFQGEAAIAIPILVNESVIGALSLRYIASSKRAADMAQSYLQELYDIADAIGAHIAATMKAESA
jgi:IclR family mhp operon transcriptional activator